MALRHAKAAELKARKKTIYSHSVNESALITKSDGDPKMLALRTTDKLDPARSSKAGHLMTM